jgi:hypothetical protein
MGQRRQSIATLSAFTLLAALLVYGILSEHLLDQILWGMTGARRFLRYSAIFWSISILIIWLKRQWLMPAVCCLALAYAIWWCGLLAPISVLFVLASTWLLGTLLKTVFGKPLRHDSETRGSDGDPALAPFPALLLGLGAWMIAMQLTLPLRVHYAWVYVVCLALPFVFGWRRLRQAVANARWMIDADRPSILESLSLALFLYILIAQALVAMNPEVSADALAMHLAAPELIVHDHRWGFEFLRFAWALMPMGADWLYTVNAMLGGEMAVKLFNFAILAATALAVRSFARRWISAAQANLTAALLLSGPLVQLVTGSLFIENTWAAFLTGSVLAMLDGGLLLSGVLFGMAMGIKFGTTGFLAPMVVAGAVIAWRRGLGRSAALALPLMLLVASPTYINAWARSGNPLYPFLNHIFKAPGIDTNEPLQDARFLEPVRWHTLYDLTFRSHLFFEGQNGGMGFTFFLLLVPAGIAAWILLGHRHDPTARRLWQPMALLGVGVAASVLTLNSQANLRYVYPALPLVALAAGIALFRTLPQAAASGMLLIAIGLNLWFLPSAGYYSKDFALFRKSRIADFVSRGAPTRVLNAELNRIAPGEPAAFFGGNAIAGFYGTAYTESWHAYSFWRQLGDFKNGAELLDLLHRLKVRYVIAPRGRSSDYLAIQELLERWTSDPVMSSGDFALFPLRDQPRPAIETPVGPGEYDDVNPRIEYRGSWFHDHQFQEAAGGTLTYSSQPDAAVRFSFRGSAVTWDFTRAANRGIVEVQVDRQAPVLVDLYSAQTRWRQSQRLEKLGPGLHTIEVRNTGRKNQSSSGLFLDVDRFVIEP